MPKGRWKKRKQRDEGKEQQSDQPAPKKQRTNDWKEWVKENPRYEEYYKGQQGIVPSEEWDQFLKALRSDLPTTFRIDRTSSFARLVRARLEQRYALMTDLRSEGEAVAAPHAMAWYPDHCGWYFSRSRRVLRKIEGAHYEEWRQFMITENELGNISRQEAVSMVPAFFLDVRADHTVLDMCAAPGSKTAQLLELIALQGHALDAHDTEAPVHGLVIANDVDRDRCNLLLTRTRTGSNLIVTNYEAQLYPTLKLLQLDGSHAPLKIDRILCDVPCSGDGTMRKNPDVWQSWHVEGGVNVHPLQVQILSRACQLLLQCPPRDSGDRERIVYSTCSLNPIEDEAVIATILQRHPELRLVNVEHVLPGLRRQPGLAQWRVRTRAGEWFDTYEALMSATQDTAQQSHVTRKYLPSMFPPSDATGLNLHYSFRLLPHHQDTGGFFVAVLERVPPSPVQPSVNNVNTITEVTPATLTPDTLMSDTLTPVNPAPIETSEPANDIPAPESSAPESRPKKQRQPKFGEPLSVLSEADLASEQWTKVKSFYGLRDDFPLRQLITRAQSGVSNRYYFVTDRARDLLQAQTHTFRVVHTGTKMFERADNQGPYCSLRICQEGAHLLYPYMTRRVVTITWEDLCTLLLNRHPFFTQFTAAVRPQLVELLQGSCLFVLPPCEQTQHNRLVFAGWRGKNSCNLQMSSEEFKSVKELLGIVDPTPVADQPATSVPNTGSTDQSATLLTDQSAASVPNTGSTDQSATLLIDQSAAESKAL